MGRPFPSPATKNGAFGDDSGWLFGRWIATASYSTGIVGAARLWGIADPKVWSSCRNCPALPYVLRLSVLGSCIVAKCPGLAGTVPVFDLLSRWCPGLVLVPDFYKGLILSTAEQSYINSQLFRLFQCIKLTSFTIYGFTELHEVSHLLVFVPVCVSINLATM